MSTFFFINLSEDVVYYLVLLLRELEGITLPFVYYSAYSGDDVMNFDKEVGEPLEDRCVNIKPLTRA